MRVFNHDTTNRTKEDWALVALGAGAAVAAWMLDPSIGSVITLNATIVGAAIVALALLDLSFLTHWEEPFEMIGGAWLMLSPAWLSYGGALMIIHIGIGAVVFTLAILEFWQDMKR